MNKIQYNFINKISSYIDNNDLIASGSKVLVCVSGGADSVCLLDVLISLKERYSLSLHVCHINHSLREAESDDDEQFVQNLCLRHNLPFYSKKYDVAKIAKETNQSIESAARQVRYDYFFELKHQLCLDVIATAHNKNDNAETVLMHMLRGSGTDGLKGIENRRSDGMIRPLLEIFRSEIEAYLIAANQDFVTDTTNFQSIYHRNKIRLELLPYLQDVYNPNIVETLSRTAKIIQQDAKYMQKQAAKEASTAIKSDYNGWFINIPELKQQHPAIATRLIRMAIAASLGNDKDITHQAVMRCYELANSKSTGGQVNISGNFFAIREYDKLRFVIKPNESISQYCIELPLNEKIHIPNNKYGMTIYAELTDEIQKADKNKKDIAYFDYNLLKGKIYIRNRREGDYFYPSGMSGKKRLKDYFIDAKIARSERETCVIIATADDILWLVGMRHTSKFAVTDKTSTILKITKESENEYTSGY